MDSQGTEEQEIQEDRSFQERLDDFQKLIDVAYQLFDGKYNIKEISEMPYKILLVEMDRAQKELEKNADSKANKKLEAEMKRMGM